MLKFKGGEGIWKRYVDEESGRDSYAEHIPKVVKQWCPEDGCYFIKTEDPRIVVCKRCGLERNFIIGFHQIKDGKLLISKK